MQEAADSAISFGAMNSVVQEVPAIFIQFPSLADDNDDFTIACMPMTEATPAACDDLPIVEGMEEMLNNCTQR